MVIIVIISSLKDGVTNSQSTYSNLLKIYLYSSQNITHNILTKLVFGSL